MRSSLERRDDFQRRMDGLILLAKTTRDAGEFAPFPFIKVAGATVVTLLESIRGIKGMRANKDACAQLAQDTVKLLEQMVSTANEVPLASTRLQKPVENFITILVNVLNSIVEIAERSFFKQYLYRASDAEKIRDLRHEINSAFTSFMTVTQIQIRQEQEWAREEQERIQSLRRAQEEQRLVREEREKERQRVEEEFEEEWWRIKEEQQREERRRSIEEQESERQRLEEERGRIEQEQQREKQRGIGEEPERERQRVEEERRRIEKEQEQEQEEPWRKEEQAEQQRVEEERQRIEKEQQQEQQQAREVTQVERRRIQEEQETKRTRVEEERRRQEEGERRRQEEEGGQRQEEEVEGRRIKQEQEKEQKRTWESKLLARLTVVPARWSEDKECLKGTRGPLLDELRSWAGNKEPSVKRIYWLADVAGSGKSTVASHVANEWHRMGHLGGCFFFSRDVSERSNTKYLFPTLCGDLVEWHPEIRPIICEAIEANPSIASGPPKDQFLSLILRPLTQIKKSVVFVLDALDECVNGDRSALLDVLLTELTNTSHPIKFLITSRPEQDISQALHEFSHNRAGFDLPGSKNLSDVRLYVESQLSPKFPGRSSVWPGPTAPEASTLAERAGGLFIWASTACKMFNDSIDPQDLLSRLLVDASLGNLDKLYMEALKLATLPSDPHEPATVAIVLHAIVMSLEPLSVDAIDELLGVRITEQVIRRLRSVLNFSDDRTKPVRILHPTFREFLVDPKRCTDRSFLVDLKGTHRRLSAACFRSMQALREDICNINDPSLLNSEIPGIEDTLVQVLTNSQRYACRFWAFHATELIEDRDIQDLALEFFNVHFLHWLEALSLMGRAGEAFWALHHFATRLQPELDCHSDLRLWSRDALKFVQLHQPLIQMSASHIYISALTFTPPSAIISQHYKPPLGTFPLVQRNQDMVWPLGLTLIAHVGRVTAVSFSPDGTRIASASVDETIRLWEATSGLPVGRPLCGHTDIIWSIAFSPDGTKIASCSADQTIRLWDAPSGSLIGTPLNGHTDVVRCIAFSPDGTRIASGSFDRTLRVWDAFSGSPIGSPLHGHSSWVFCIAFSPKGTHIASGSFDKTIRLWDAISGLPISTPFDGHTDSIWSITFSPDGTRIASASSDKTIRLWDIVSGSTIFTLLHGHTDIITSIKFSPNGSHIASSSFDKTIRLWDTTSGILVGTPLEGHTDRIWSIAFSPDGTRIASGSSDYTVRIFDEVFSPPFDTSLENHIRSLNCISLSPNGKQIASGSSDKTVRFWDAASFLSVGVPLIGHTGGVSCIIFSSDGSRIATGSEDNTVRIWDPLTGLPLGPPLTCHWKYGVRSLTFSPDYRTIEASYSLEFQYSWRLDDVQRPASVTTSGAHDQATLSEVETIIELDDGWVCQVSSHRRRLFYIPQTIRRFSAVRGSRIVTTSEQGQLALIDSSKLLS